MNECIFTIGHSNHEIKAFIDLLHQHGVTAIVDVRSHPYSRWVQQYSREALKSKLADDGIAYVFLGKELGARSDNPACYRHGKVQYDRLAQEPGFAIGIKRVMKGLEHYRIALMCAEKDPLDCHRALLVARRLFENGVPVSHIHHDGAIESHRTMESRLLTLRKLPEGDMFRGRDEYVAEAYAKQGERVAYQDETMEQNERVAAP